MKKIYAKTLNPEFFDYRIYDIREDEGNNVIINGGREYPDIDPNGELKAIKNLLGDYCDYDLDVYYEGSIKAYIKDMLYPLKKANGKDFSPREIHTIKELILDDTNDEAIEIILSIIHCEKWICKTIRGYCQGEVAWAYAPKREEKYLEWIEAWFFGTGTEVEVHDANFEPESAEDIEGWTFYTASWKIEDIKDEVASYFKEEVEVVLYLYKNTRTINIDQYELAGE